MKQGTVKFSKEFVTPIGLHEWITLEWPVDEPFDEKKAMETFTKVKEFVCNYKSWPIYDPIYSTTPPPTSAPIISVERTSETERIAKLIKDIYACTELDGENGLLSYAKVAATTSRETQQVYDIVFRKLAPGKYESLDDNK